MQYHTVELSKDQPSTFELTLSDVALIAQTKDYQPYKFMLYK